MDDVYNPFCLAFCQSASISSRLAPVAVRVAPSDKPPPPEAEMAPEDWSEVIPPELGEEADGVVAAQQQQQQQ